MVKELQNGYIFLCAFPWGCLLDGRCFSVWQLHQHQGDKVSNEHPMNELELQSKTF